MAVPPLGVSQSRTVSRDTPNGAAIHFPLSMRKLSRFLPALISAAIHLGIAPRPAQVSDRFFGLRYLGATFRPFTLLIRRLSPPLPRPKAASWLCNCPALSLRIFPISLRISKRTSTDIE